MSKPRAVSASSATAPTSSVTVGAGAYADLLPGPGWQESRRAPEGSPEALPTTLRIASDDISGRIDIPLIHRKNAGAERASAKIVLLSPTRWRFAYIDGAPLLRASLYESLRTEPNKTNVLRLLTDAQLDELLVTLRFDARVADVPAPRLERLSEATRGRIAVRYALLEPPVAGGGGGGGLSMALPDAEADRARLRDRVHLERLQQSAAYIAPIRDRDP